MVGFYIHTMFDIKLYLSPRLKTMISLINIFSTTYFNQKKKLRIFRFNLLNVTIHVMIFLWTSTNTHINHTRLS